VDLPLQFSVEYLPRPVGFESLSNPHEEFSRRQIGPL
jgi:hypothetical protein